MIIRRGLNPANGRPAVDALGKRADRFRVGRSYTSRVIQTFKADGVLETRRGSIMVRNPDSLRIRACLCNDAVKNHFEEVLRGVYPTPEKGN